ncbi:nitroreductase family protein [Helicobacter turcicus]|uniref:Nitroreductase family protein n=1 Tax=Helicobacter turcicus TaxID=2867412 RepID=A0ABS7JL14_9HELI|nr:nitroreductase family protein [Helicobacter turcicus]MBX7490083.1 nitroreductase family protein [Helicobacter turcicus]MBX7544942.1 nitroreductase family protein [Helicobacter turcicus]
MDFLEIVNARYSCRNFKDSAISAKDLDFILETGRLAPSSLGLEPWIFYVVQDPKKKKEIAQIANGQSQVEHCGAIIIIVSRLDFGEYFEGKLRERNLPEKEIEKRLSLYKPFIDGMHLEKKLSYAREQAHLALMNMANAATSCNLASCIIGGFDNVALDRYLGLGESEKSAVMLVVGEPKELAILEKIRNPKAEVIRFW